VQGKAKVAWDCISVPKCEGDLGIKKLVEWNQASILRHIWASSLDQDLFGWLGLRLF
jgi:hypothetical protein